MRKIEANRVTANVRVGIVVSRWNELITKELLAGALDALETSGLKDITIVSVPGTWEIPPACKCLLKKVDAVIALGCIMQGATSHAQLLAQDVSSELMRMQTEFEKPISWGILTPETTEQALDRAGMKRGNKGREAVSAALELFSVLEQIKN